MNQIFLQSCEVMNQLADDMVSLTVTSPPYSNSIDYESHAADPSANYRPRQELDYDRYLNFLETVFGEVLRVTRPGGFCAVVIGTVLEKGRHIPLPFHLTVRMEQLGWTFHQDIVWSKVTGGVKRAGSVIQRPYPGYYYPNLMLEYILIFRKPGAKHIYEGRSPEEKEKSRFELDSVFTKDIANNIWHIAPVPPGQLEHPCPFPEEIPYRLIRLYSYVGDLVLDPFSGTGTTLKVAQHLGRKWVGYEVLESYCSLAARRVAEPLILRKQLIELYDKIEYGEQVGATREKAGKKRRPFRKASAVEPGLAASDDWRENGR